METSLRICLCVLIVQQAVGAAKHGGEKMGARVVIHVGPHKTGTKSVQDGLRDRKALLESDGWAMPSPEVFKGSFDIASAYDAQGNGKQHKSRAYSRWLETISQLKGTTHNMLVSCEKFAKLNIDIAQLASDLSQTHNTIVVAYRPFYEWIASLYRQLRLRMDRKLMLPMNYVDWLFPPTGSKSGFTTMRKVPNTYTTKVYSRFAAHFSDIKVHTVGPSFLTEIVCDDLNATRTCVAFQKSTLDHNHVSPKGSLAGGCLSALQLQTLENISADLHKEMFGSLSGFSTSDFHAQELTCFGNR